MNYRHARLLEVPDAHSLGGARLEAIRQEVRGKRRDVVIDYEELQAENPGVLALLDGRVQESVAGTWVPRRLRLWGVRQLELDGLFSDLNRVRPNHPVRDLRGILFFRAVSGQHYCILHPGAEPARLVADARRCIQERRDGATRPASVVRDWSPAPPSPPRRVPDPRNIRLQYGGDPVAIKLGRRILHRRLFIGDLSMQGEQRPQVDAVLNLGEEAGAWFQYGDLKPEDRWMPQGEGSLGMSLATIANEAARVAELLRQGKRVLVHCLAGMNRSATICTAALIHLEEISAEAALQRVREHHPWAHPDSTHWLRLRWLGR